jgi:sulfur carrier protein
VIVLINGEEVAVRDDFTVADAVLSVCSESKGVAVAVDRQVVPRSEWQATTLHQGAHVEVLTAAAGG